jgi:TRAP transporter TAXI family solute receptor
LGFAVATCAGLLTACESKPMVASAPPQEIRLLTGAFSEPWSNLADYANARSSTFHITVAANNDPYHLLSAIQQGEGDIGVAPSDATYPTYQRGTAEYPHPHTRLRGIAVVGMNKLYLIVRTDSPIRVINDLRDTRVAIGSNERLADTLLRAYGLKPSDVRKVVRTGDEMIADLEDHRVDAAFLQLRIDFVWPMNRLAHVRAVPIDRHAMNELVSQYSFVKPVKVALGEFGSQQEPVETVGTDALLVCRDDLGDELIHDLTALLFEWLSRDLTGLEPWRRADPESGPATSIPLHSGAARFYRAREILR